MLTRALALLFSCCIARELGAQCPKAYAPILVGSEWEQYVRLLQVVGGVALEPWTVREPGPRELAQLTPTDSTLPWAHVPPAFAQPICIEGVPGFWLAPHGQVIGNSGFPFGFNDGAIWAGRGLTGALDAGINAVAGPLSVTFAPVAFSSQNVAFTTKANGLTGKRRFADWRHPGEIDLPQRFGEGAYQRFDLGQSTARIDFPVIALGVSTANQFFGPAFDHPIILGDNAAGFPHIFLASSAPLRVWRLGAVHGRVFYGKLGESEFSPLAGSGFSRLASGIAGVFQPAGFPGLEIGGARFFHVLQTRFGLPRDEILRPFGAFLSAARARQTGTTFDEPDNQLGSVFARLTLPSSGIEVYGEFGREDRNLDTRELVFLLDHDSAYLLGLRKASRSEGRIRSFRAELLNSRVTHLALSSGQSSWYIHSRVPQGHTQRGQALGSAAGYGGGASTLAFEQYDRRGRWGVEWLRMQLAETREPAPDQLSSDVVHMLSASMLRFGPRVDYEFSVGAIYELNRYFESDARGLRTTIGIRPSSRPAR